MLTQPCLLTTDYQNKTIIKKQPKKVHKGFIALMSKSLIQTSSQGLLINIRIELLIKSMISGSFSFRVGRQGRMMKE